MMMTARGPMFLSDTAINITNILNYKIAIMTAKTARMFGGTCDMVSFSNFGSSTDENATKERSCRLFT
jgi:malate dehydrogenase (oxaloacetate-decarboxylating)(NADP+)